MKYRVAATIRRLIVALGTTVAMVTVFANSDARATEIGSDSAAVSQASSALGFAEACFNCWAGPEAGCGFDQHRDDMHSGDGYLRGEYHNGCVLSLDPKHLCGEHDWCGSLVEELRENAALLLERDDRQALSKLISNNASKLRLDNAESLLLVIGCDGTVDSQFTLTRSQVRALEAPKGVE